MRKSIGVLIAAAILAGCNAHLPVIFQPHEVTRERLLYVPIPAGLVHPHPVATGPLSECPAVAAARRTALEACNADLSAIGAVQGTAPEPAGAPPK